MAGGEKSAKRTVATEARVRTEQQRYRKRVVLGVRSSASAQPQRVLLCKDKYGGHTKIYQRMIDIRCITYVFDEIEFCFSAKKKTAKCL